MASLEEVLGTQLVERTTRRVLLTPAGERIAEPARRVLEALDALVETASAVRRPLTGELALGVIPTVAPYLLPALLPYLDRSYPELVPRVFEEQTERLLDGLVNGRIDVALLALPTDHPATTELGLYAEEFVLAVPADHEYASAATLRRSALRELSMLLLDEGHCLRDQALDVCREAGQRHPALTRAASLSTLTQLVAAGLGATLLPATALSVETGRAALATVRFAAPAPGRRIGLVHRASSPRGAEFARLAAELRSAIREADLPVELEG